MYYEVGKMATFGEILTELRKNRGFKQHDMAEMLSVTRNTISGYETNKFSPDIPNLIKLAKIFDVPLDYLLGASHSNINARNYDSEYIKHGNKSVLTVDIVERILKFSLTERNLLIEYIEFLEYRFLSNKK